MDFWLNRNGMILSCRCVQHWMPHGDTIVGRNDFPCASTATLFFRSPYSHAPRFPLAAESVNTLFGAEAFRLRLLELIAGAEKRIYLTALYLQDDEAGREVLDALHAAKALAARAGYPCTGRLAPRPARAGSARASRPATRPGIARSP